MGNWKQVVKEQFDSLKKAGLTSIHAVHVGEDVEWFVNQAIRQGIDMKLELHHDNVAEKEYFTLLLVERIARESNKPILYFHTKGVSHNDGLNRDKWRRLMHKHVVEDWQTNLQYLKDHDAVGVNWIPCSTMPWVFKNAWMRPHFCGNFWIATAEWIRQLPPFSFYFHSLKMPESAELWIGSTPGCKYKSLACTDMPFWDMRFNWDTMTLMDNVGDHWGLVYN